MTLFLLKFKENTVGSRNVGWWLTRTGSIGYRENKSCFSVNVSKPDKPFRSGSISEQLKAMVLSAMKCSLGKVMQVFDLLRQKRGEFDLVIVTHCNVIIVELKDWNHQPVTARGDTWFKGDKNMGRSPVSVTRSKNSCWTKTQASGRPFYEQRLYPDCSFLL